MIETTSLEQVQERVIRSDFDILRLQHPFDIEAIRARTLRLLEQYPPQPKDGQEDYLGVGLQYSDESDPIYDAVPSLAFITPEGVRNPIRARKFFTKINNLGSQFPELFDHLRPTIRSSRMRMVLANPGFRMKAHQDGAQCATIHLAIQTAPEAQIFVGDQGFHIPSDGHLYVLNAACTHFVWNQSSEVRIHITVPLTPFSFRHWTQEQVARLGPHVNMFKLKFDLLSEYLLSRDPYAD